MALESARVVSSRPPQPLLVPLLVLVGLLGVVLFLHRLPLGLDLRELGRRGLLPSEPLLVPLLARVGAPLRGGLLALPASGAVAGARLLLSRAADVDDLFRPTLLLLRVRLMPAQSRSAAGRRSLGGRRGRVARHLEPARRAPRRRRAGGPRLGRRGLVAAPGAAAAAGRPASPGAAAPTAASRAGAAGGGIAAPTAASPAASAPGAAAAAPGAADDLLGGRRRLLAPGAVAAAAPGAAPAGAPGARSRFSVRRLLPGAPRNAANRSLGLQLLASVALPGGLAPLLRGPLPVALVPRRVRGRRPVARTVALPGGLAPLLPGPLPVALVPRRVRGRRPVARRDLGGIPGLADGARLLRRGLVRVLAPGARRGLGVRRLLPGAPRGAANRGL